MNSEEIQNGVAAIMALKQLYDTFQPKKETPEPKKEPINIVIKARKGPITKDQELRKKAYLGLDSLELPSIEGK